MNNDFDQHAVEKNESESGEQEIPRRVASDPLFLSDAQLRLWFLDKFQPNSPLYNIPKAMRMSGDLNVEVLQEALNAIVNRHEPLRATFASVNENPVQTIAKSRSVNLSVIDLGDQPVSEHETQVQHLLKEEARRSFNLSQDLMLRATLIRMSEKDHVLLLTTHQIVADNWSMEVLFKELSILYEAFSTGKPSPLPDLHVQHVDFTAWQKGWLQGEVFESQLSYWRDQLHGASPLLELPIDHPRPAIETHQGACQYTELPTGLVKALRHLSRREGVTLFITLLSAFKILLYRYTTREDIIVGSPFDNRNHSMIKNLIGTFANILVLRTDLSGNPTFRQLLNRVNEVCRGARKHQDLPFERLVEELQPERSLSHGPLFQIMFALQEIPRRNMELSSIVLSDWQVHNGMSKVDITLSITAAEEGLHGAVEYNTDLFDASTPQRMLEHFQILLEGIVNDPDQKISALPILKESERHQLLVEWNNTHSDYPADKCIHQLFEAQVERIPDAVAAVFEDQQMTYRELNARANQLAHYLRRHGVGPEVLVGICMERSLDMVIGLLGTLKAGGAYVPLDPAYPKERLAFMLEDTQAPVLLTQENLIERLPKHKAHVLCLDKDWEIVLNEDEENPVCATIAENLAYVIYTSGSTGKPKGAMISHRSLCNHMFWMQEQFPLTDSDRVLQKTPFSFDASIWEFYAPLLAGAGLVMARSEDHYDIASLVRVIADQKISVIQFVPSLLRTFLEAEDLESCNSLKRVFCGGEALTLDLQERLFAKLNVDIYNLYGTTETCIDSTFWPCKREWHQQIVPIGRPIANTQAYILDRYRQPVPIGVPGELHIAGTCLARGYLNRPELTAQKFIPNPFSNEPGSRLYSTGDLARYLPDGNIEFLGRMDHQVKLHGLRIELGEIEVVLDRYHRVKETVVIAREDVPGDKYLAAYVVPKRGQSPTGSDLRKFLKEKLPDYMVPSAFVLMDALPLTPNGKTDRQALPAPERTRPDLEEGFVAPRTLVEQQIADIWSEVLQLERIGIYDDFFNLGGHSLLAIQVISRLRKAFQIEVPLRVLFEIPTIADLSAFVETVVSLGNTKNRMLYLERADK